ncbi:helix-turn-helix domain-containing protein [Bifidobacterium magnum]|uniref:helix-turn-helix domain-containing protein n=1 Tax=Bifidobacterium magnum TaxID=1692 RepID=UPI0003B56109|nr:helix-turn-helix transcriptional regulator [Bifidobacterium magnum]
MKTGELIKKYRNAAGLTQVQLAEKCGMTDSEIRNYELGNRTPGDEQISAIASALEVSPEALREIPLTSARQALELLFRIQDEFGLTPGESDGDIVLKIDSSNNAAPKLVAALKAWKDVVDSENAGEMTHEEVEQWKASFA